MSTTIDSCSLTSRALISTVDMPSFDSESTDVNYSRYSVFLLAPV